MALEFTAEERATIDGIVARYPNKAAALLPVLHLTQEKYGALPPEAQLLVAHTLDVAPTRVREVVTFYEMFHEHPEGQFHIELCTNIACHLAGADLLMKHLVERLGIEIGHQTEDGMFSLMEVECLASCGSGPMMKVGMDYYEHLDEASIDTLLGKLKALAPSLGGKAYLCQKSGPHTGPVPGHNPALPVVHPQGAPAKEEAAKAEAAKPDAKADPAKAQAAKPDTKAEPAKADPAKADPAKADPAKAAANAEGVKPADKPVAAKADTKAEPAKPAEKVEAAKPAEKAEAKPVEAPKAEPEKVHDAAAAAKAPEAASNDSKKPGPALPSFEAPRTKSEDKAGK
ncbi:MAG: NAD(P)H-dependent oxidoreductase subunit E [Deltaproteobacteria bacterium]|jgi:NADH-quinone oxidoreductase E subunit